MSTSSADAPQSGPESPRGTRPDAITAEYVVLVKGCSLLRLTHQIRLAAYMASTTGRQLLLLLKPGTALAPGLQAFIAEHSVLVVVREGH